MFSVCNNNCIKPWANQKQFRENNKDLSIYVPVWVERHEFFFTHKGLQKSDTNNKSVALTVLFVSYKNE